MIPIVVKGHERPIRQLKYNADGDILLSVANDKRVCVWYSKTGELLGTTDQHGAAISCIDIDRASRYFVTSSNDFCIQFWNLRTGLLLEYTAADEEGNEVRKPMQLKCPAIPRYVQLSPDEKQLLVVHDTKMGKESAIFVYDLDMSDLANPKLELHKTIKPPQSAFLKAAWTYDGGRIVAICADHSVCRMNVASGECEETSKIHEKPIVDLQMSPDRTYFITASRDESAVLLPVDNFQTLVKKYQGDSGLNSAAISPIKDIIIAGGGKESRDVTTTSGGSFDAHFFNKIYQADLGRVGGHFGPINSIAIHPFGTSYSSGAEDGTIRIHHFDKDYFEFDYSKIVLQQVEE